MKLETLYASTYTALAGRLGEDRNSIARALSEPDAPEKGKRGWVVSEVENFMFLRRLRKMTDAAFQELCSEVEHGSLEEGEAAAIADFRRGGRLAMIEELENAPPMTEQDLDELEAMIAEMRQL
jgi:hypothetical protein